MTDAELLAAVRSLAEQSHAVDFRPHYPQCDSHRRSPARWDDCDCGRNDDVDDERIHILGEIEALFHSQCPACKGRGEITSMRREHELASFEVVWSECRSCGGSGEVPNR